MVRELVFISKKLGQKKALVRACGEAIADNRNAFGGFGKLNRNAILEKRKEEIKDGFRENY